MPPEEQRVCVCVGRLGLPCKWERGLSLRAGLKGSTQHGQGSGTHAVVAKGMDSNKLNNQ